MLEVVGAFLDGNAVEECADGFADGVLGASGGFSELVLELGEGLLDRVEVGGVFGEEQQLGAGPTKRLTDAAATVALQIVHDHHVAQSQGRQQHLFDIDEEMIAVDRAIEQPRASMRSFRSAATKVMVFQWPYGILAGSRRLIRLHKGAVPASLCNCPISLLLSYVSKTVGHCWRSQPICRNAPGHW
jgi:hypothetical protein